MITFWRSPLQRPDASSGRLAFYFGVRYATPLLVLIAVAASTVRPRAADLTSVLTAHILLAIASNLLALRNWSSLGFVVATSMFVDVVTISALVWLTGGLGGPLVFLFTLHALSAGILLSSRAGARMIALSTIAIVTLDVLSKTATPAGTQLPRGLAAAAALWILGGAGTLFSAFNERALRRRTAELATIRRVTLDIEDSLSLKDICADLCQGVVSGFAFHAAAVLQREGDTLVVAGAHGVTGPLDGRVAVRGKIEAAMASTDSLVVPGAEARRDAGLVDLIGPRGYVAVPIEDGILIATRSARHGAARVRAHEIESLERLAHHARLAIANARLHERVSQMAKTDALTGVLNRGEMNRLLEAELGRIARYSGLRAAGHHPSVLLIDIDHFKAVNDKHGHQAGDAVLRVVAATLRNAVRSFDIVARYGGEEFAVILPGTSAESARDVAERIRRAIGSEPSYTTDDGKRVRVTISAGIATSPENGTTTEALFKAADTALYRCKEEGRNRSRHASDGSSPVAKVLRMDVSRRRQEPDGDPVRDGSKRARARSSLPKRRTPRA